MRVYHRVRREAGTVLSGPWEPYEGPRPTVRRYYIVDGDNPTSEEHSPMVWWVHLCDPLAEEPSPDCGDYPHIHEPCGSYAYIGLLYVDCLKCGKLAR